jgi:serine protease Do
MLRTVRELEAGYSESALAAALGQREATVARRPGQAYAYAIETGYRTRGYLGVTFDGAMAEIPSSTNERIIRFFQYPRIALVEGNSPAERAGVLVGDTVMALNGDDLREREFSFTKLLVPNATVVMRVQRGGNSRDLKVKVGESPEYYARRIESREPLMQGEPTPMPRAGGGGSQVRVYGSPTPTPAAPPALYWFSNESVMGARIETITEGLGKAVGVKSGVLVIRAAPATPAYRSGLRDGDVVIRVGGDDVSSVRQFRNALATREHDGAAKLVIVRDGKKQDVTLRW